jgi:hypothetical protein
MIKTTRMIMLLAIAFMSVFSWAAEYSAKIFYIPFDIKTYSPITINKIEHSAFVQANLREKWGISDLMSCIERTNRIEFNDQMVRLKVIVSGETYYFDSFGNGVLNSSIGVKLNKKKAGSMFSANGIYLRLGPNKNDLPPIPSE